MEQNRDIETFEPTRMINPGIINSPKTGSVGYVDVLEVDDYEDVGPTIGVFCPAILDEDEADDEYHIETVNVDFRPECVINM